MSKEKIEIQYPKCLAYFWNDETNQLNMMAVEIEVYKTSDTTFEVNIINLSHPELLDTAHKYNTFLDSLKGEVPNYKKYSDSDIVVVYNGEILEYKPYTDEELERCKRNREELEKSPFAQKLFSKFERNE